MTTSLRQSISGTLHEEAIIDDKDKEPGGDAKHDTKQINNIQQYKRPISDLQHDERPISDVLHDKQPISDAHHDKQPISDLQHDKRPISDAERQQLAERLDHELDDFIDGLKPSRYKHGWNESTWQEEMQQHPFFRTKPLDEREPLPPLIAGLQSVKYDRDTNTDHELAVVHKRDGNVYFGAKKYRRAVDSYTEALRLRGHTDRQLLTQLLTNRAAAHFHLHNMRSCRLDCERALRITPDHTKALRRGLMCCRRVQLFDQALDYCYRLLADERGADDGSDRTQVLQWRREIGRERAEAQRCQRQQERAARDRDLSTARLLDTVCGRNVRFLSGPAAVMSGEQLRAAPQLLIASVAGGVSDAVQSVHLTQAAAGPAASVSDAEWLVWPLLLLYPQYDQMDAVAAADERHLLHAHVAEVLSPLRPPPVWDRHSQYTDVDAVAVYYEAWPSRRLVTVPSTATIGWLVSRPDFVVIDGVPRVVVLPTRGDFRQRYLAECKA